jgi:hypothetical protein
MVRSDSKHRKNKDQNAKHGVGGGGGGGGSKLKYQRSSLTAAAERAKREHDELIFLEEDGV